MTQRRTQDANGGRARGWSTGAVLLVVVCLVAPALVGPALASPAHSSISTATEAQNGDSVTYVHMSVSSVASSSLQGQGQGQAGGNNSTDGGAGGGAGAAPANATNGTNATNATGGQGQAGGGGGGMFGMPDPSELFNITAYYEQTILLLNDGKNSILQAALNVGLGTPYPINDGWLNAFGEPTGENGYRQPYDEFVVGLIAPIMLSLTVLGLVIIIPITAILSVRQRYLAVRYLWKLLMALVVLAFSWQFITLYQMFVDMLTMAVAPTPEELTATPGNAGKSLTSTLVGAGVLAIVGVSEGVVLGLFYTFRQAILWTAPFGMGIILWIMYFAPHRYIRLFGSVVWWQYNAILWYTFPAAFFWALALALPWEASLQGAANIFVSTAMMVVPIGFPILLSASAAAIPLVLARRSTNVSKAVGGRARQRYRSFRGTDDSGADGDGGDGGAGTGGGNGDSGGGRPGPAVTQARVRPRSPPRRSARQSSRGSQARRTRQRPATGQRAQGAPEQWQRRQRYLREQTRSTNARSRSR